MKKIYILMSIILILNCGCDKRDSHNGQKNFRLGHVFAKDSVTDKSSVYFSELIYKKTHGKIKIDVFPSSQLGSDEVIYQNVSRGSLELAFLNQGSLTGTDKLFGFSYLPYIAKNQKEADVLFYGKGIIPQTINNTLRKHNIRSLGTYELEFRTISNSVKPIKKVEDLKNLSIRVPNNIQIKKFFEVIESNPVELPMSELYQSLQQGVVKGQDNGYIITKDNLLHETNKYITETNHIYATGSIVISDKIWGELSKKEKKIFLSAAKETTKWQIKKNRAQIAQYKKQLLDEKVIITKLDNKTLNNFQKRAQKVWSTSNIPKNLINSLNKEIENLNE